MRGLILVLGSLALGACQEPSGQATPAPQESAQPIPVEPDGGIGDGAGPPGIDPEAGMIPARFVGVWDSVDGGCNAASELHMEIEPRQIRFYESVGNIAGVGADGEDTLVDLVMEGEGEQWVQVTRLSLSADGEALSVSDGSKPKTEDEFRRKRCD